MPEQIRLNNLKGTLLHREATIERQHIDEENRTVELAFSSETPVERFFFIEILDHDPKSVRLGRLNDSAPLLADHNSRVQVGVIEPGSAKVDKDKRGRAVVRFGRVGRADEEFQNVIDGIRTKVSVGYFVHDFEETRDSKDDPITVRVTDWEPIEISFVALPADNSVGVGRTEPIQEGIDMPDEEKSIDQKVEKREQPDSGATIRVEREAAASEARKCEQNRAEKILGAAKLYPNNTELRELAETCIVDGTSLEDFQSRAIPLIGKAQALPNDDRPLTELDMEKKQIKQFSILRAVRAIANQQQGGKHWADEAPFEHECTTAIEDAIGKESRGFFVPYDVQRGSPWADPMTIAQRMRNFGIQYRVAPMDTSGQSDLLATEHLAGSFIEAMRAESVVMVIGARPLTGLVGNVDIPRNDTPAVFGWLAEDGSSADTEIVTGTVSLSPKTVSGSVPITRRLRQQSSPDVEQLVRSDLVKGAALAIDLGALNGSGAAGQPQGIIGTTGLGTSTIASAGDPTWVELVEFETDVAAANGLAGSLWFVMTAAVRGAGKVKDKAVGAAQFVITPVVGAPGASEVNGYPIVVSTQMPANGILFGNFNEVLIGMWGVLDIRVDTATNAAKDRVTLRAFQDVDVAVRHAASFSKNA